jgi:hypothetical protein
MRPPRTSLLSCAAAAALLAGGCRVSLDGAPCRGPGTAADCPDGQACGNDLRCSARALACAASRCTPGEGACEGGLTAAAILCTGADPVCGRRVRDDCAVRGMVCGTQPGVDLGACRCPPEVQGPIVVADPGGSPSRDAHPYPNGQASPRECRFGRLSDALAEAAALAPQAATVQIEAEEAGTIAFGQATAEAWPLLVASNVTLAGVAAPAGPALIRGAPGAPAVLSVEGAVEDVRVDADSATTGVHVGAPGARLVRVEVGGAAGPALEVTVGADPATAATVEVLGGSYGASDIGIWIRGGRVSVAPDPAHASTAVASENAGSTIVAGNVRDGVVIGGMAPRLPLTMMSVDAVLSRVLIADSGGTGITVAGLPPSSRVSVTGSDIRGNGTGEPTSYGAVGSGGPRTAAGVFVQLASGVAFTFHANRLWSNLGDQLAFDPGTWSIAAPDCGALSNVFACIPGGCNAGTCAVALLGSGTVQAAYTVWPGIPTYAYATPNNVLDIEAPTFCMGDLGEPPKPSCQ